MSQATYVIADSDGATFLTALDAALAAFATGHAGTADPSYKIAGMGWWRTDIPGTGVWTWYIYDGTSKVALFTINTSTHAITLVDTVLQLPKGFVSGFTYQNNGSDATNDLDIAAGYAVDATGARLIVGAALTKRSDAAWAVGTGNGFLDTGSIGNSDYYIWAILRSDTGVVDYLCSLSASAPTMPTGYDYKRLIGWFKRSGGTIVAFKTYEIEGGGLRLSWTAPTLDVDLSNTLTTSRRTDAVKVPLLFAVEVNLRVFLYDAAGITVALVCCPDETDAAPSASAAPLFNVYAEAGGGVADLWVRTSSTGTVAARGIVATVDNYRIVTQGFRWSRR